MKRILLSFILLFAGCSIYAQQDRNAREILDKVTQTMQSCKSIEAGFSFEMENKEQHINEKHTGNIVLKGNKYVVRLQEMGLEVYSDGKNVSTYMKEANEVTISTFGADQENGLMDPSKVFTIYKNGFDYKYIGEEHQNGKNVYVIDLIPQKNNENTYSRIKVSIDKEKMIICSAAMQGKDGNTYTVTVDQFKTDKPLNDSFFVFDPKKYPGIEVTDMR